MARPSDPALAEQWTQRFERYATFSGPVAAFCQAEGVSVAAFYQWRRKLSRAAAPTRGATRRGVASKPRAAAFQPVQVVAALASPVTVRLGDAIAVELGSDAETIARVVAQLWDLQRAAGTAAC
jgi:hypothetical protein